MNKWYQICKSGYGRCCEPALTTKIKEDPVDFFDWVFALQLGLMTPLMEPFADERPVQ
jgi:hypothetical protein